MFYDLCNHYQTCQIPLLFNLVSTTSVCTSLRLQFLCTYSLPTPNICSTFPITGAFGIQSNIYSGAFLQND